MNEVFSFFAFSLVGAIFGFLGAFFRISKGRGLEFAWGRIFLIFFCVWILGSLITFLLLICIAFAGIPAVDPARTICMLVVSFLIARRMIEYRDNIKK